MYVSKTFLLAVGLAALLPFSFSHAASVVLDEQTYEKPVLRMSGVIETGDAEKLVSVVLPRLTTIKMETLPTLPANRSLLRILALTVC